MNAQKQSDDFPTTLVAPKGYIWRTTRTSEISVTNEKEVKLHLFMGVLPIGW